MNCIKCGREIPDGELFCVACSMAPDPPEPARPAKGAQKPKAAARPQAKAAEPKTTAPKTAARNAGARPQTGARAAAQPERRGRTSKKLVAALVIVCLLLAGAVAYIAVNQGQIVLARRQLRTKEADLLLRETSLEELQSTRDTLTQQLEEAKGSIAELEAQIEDLEQQLSESQNSVSQSQYDMTSQQQEMDLLTQENAELLSQVEGLESDLAKANSQVSQLTAANATYSAKANFMDTYVVFVNNDGTKLYHTYDCSEFKRDSFWAYSRKLAESNGYSPCSKCCR